MFWFFSRVHDFSLHLNTFEHPIQPGLGVYLFHLYGLDEGVSDGGWIQKFPVNFFSEKLYFYPTLLKINLIGFRLKIMPQ